MREVTRLLQRIEQGHAQASTELFPMVYEELRRVAAARMAGEPPGQTLGATALVHETYLKLVGNEQDWTSRGHFFAVAAEAMRRILVDRARAKGADKRGAGRQRVDLDIAQIPAGPPDDRLLLLDDALDRLAHLDPRKADLVKLRYFAGCSIQEAAEFLGISTATADRDWAYARAWLQTEMSGDDGGDGPG